jgi:hypothetical protein
LLGEAESEMRRLARGATDVVSAMTAGNRTLKSSKQRPD